MRKVVAERYPVGDWNIYAAQASDGDNMSNDNAKSAALLENVILPMCQYFAYIEVSQDYEGGLGGALGATLGPQTGLGPNLKPGAKPGSPDRHAKGRTRREI